jgi:endonuclease-8
MEGPSLVILMEDLAPFLGKKVVQASGVYPQAPLLVQQTLREAKSWGKHALLFFDDCILRIHFLLFGSYIINKEKEGRVPKLKLQFESGTVNFHACAIRSVSEQEIAAYDWSVDLMSPAWDARHVEELVMAQGSRPICDVLMDQDIFAGLGNIIKNEVLFLLKLHPDTPTSSLNAGMRRRLVQEVRDYSLQFYRWKKAGELKKHWKIFRKQKCTDCGRPLVKEETGKSQRVSYYCPVCQSLTPVSVRSVRTMYGKRTPHEASGSAGI